MSADVISILALAAIFAVAIGMSLNMGYSHLPPRSWSARSPPT